MLPSETMLETWRQRKRPTHGHHVSKLSFGQLHGGGGGGGGGGFTVPTHCHHGLV